VAAVAAAAHLPTAEAEPELATAQNGEMRILVTAVFEQIVYHCACIDDRDPGHPRLEVDAILRDGDADGPLLLPVADYKRMAGFDNADVRLPAFRSAGRTEKRDGVEYLVFPVWERVG
jgi:hypothetical protein